MAANAKWNTLKEFLDEVKANPGKIKGSGTGKGGIWDLRRAGMLTTAGIPVKTRSPGCPPRARRPGLQELIAGGVGVVHRQPPRGPIAARGQEGQGAGDHGRPARPPCFKDVPTLKENGINWVIGAWRGFALPKGAKPEVVSFYEAAIKKVYDSKEYKDFMTSKGYGMVWRSAQDFGTFMAEQDASMGKIMKELGLAK